MCRLIAHRGPDGEGVWMQGPVGLGHRRLSIIDLSDAGRQPMAYAGGTLQIAFNGEIYNHTTLREELQRRGYTFTSRTDTEVVVAAYHAYGLEFLQRLHGMFAFALWDGPRRRLLLARDRVGKKPLHYTRNRHGLAFASEARALLADPEFAARPNLEAILHYLSYQCVPAPLSGFDGVQKLPPAHYLLVEDGQVSVRRYWRLKYGTKRRVSEDEAREELTDRLKEAVRIRLMSDVPLGAFLSGGIDSGAVVALMSQVGTGRVKTFSIGFEQKEYDELRFARRVATRYGTDHHEFVVRPDAAAILPKIVWHYSEPYADSSAIPTYYLAQLTRQHVTVALNGDAGDENFAGYDRYVANAMAERFGALPAALRGPVAKALGSLPASFGPKHPIARLRRLAEGLDEPAPRRYARWMMHFHPSIKAALCTAEFLEASGGRDSTDLLAEAFASSDATNLVDATLDVDVRTYLPDDLLVKVDITTMAHGLEGRSPFLDTDLMQFAAELPPDLKLRGRTKKYLLKQAMRPFLPADIIDRPKMGFAVPLDHWFRGELKTMAADILLGDRARARGYFNMSCVEQMLTEHARGTRTWHPQLWNLLMLELWHRTFIDERPGPAPLG